MTSPDHVPAAVPAELADAVSDMVESLVEVSGVVAVALGGSRARGDHHQGSDVDLGLYYRPPLDVGALQAVAGPRGTVSRPGDWGPMVDGGAWLSIDGVAVDWIYRDLDRADAAWADACAGRVIWVAQAGHPLGVPSVAYAGEVALARVLADPAGELAERVGRFATYPPALAEALVGVLWEAGFLVDVARKGATRGDTAYVAGCLFRAVLLCAHALHGRSGRWLVNEKGAIAAAGRLPPAPVGFAERAQDLLAGPGRTAGSLATTLDAAAALVADVGAACR